MYGRQTHIIRILACLFIQAFQFHTQYRKSRNYLFKINTIFWLCWELIKHINVQYFSCVILLFGHDTFTLSGQTHHTCWDCERCFKPSVGILKTDELFVEILKSNILNNMQCNTNKEKKQRNKIRFVKKQ